MSEQVKKSALKRRKALQQQAAEIGIDQNSIRLLVQCFYQKIRQHAVLGLVFDAGVSDWDEHRDLMERFWRSVLLNSGEYSGKPVQIHVDVPGIEICQFPIWLRLMRETLDEMSPNPEFSDIVQKRSQNIANSLMAGLRRSKVQEVVL